MKDKFPYANRKWIKLSENRRRGNKERGKKNCFEKSMAPMNNHNFKVVKIFDIDQFPAQKAGEREEKDPE